MCLFFASDLLQWNEWVSEQKEKGWHTQYIAAAAVDLSDINPHILFNNDNSSNDDDQKKTLLCMHVFFWGSIKFR